MGYFSSGSKTGHFPKKNWLKSLAKIPSKTFELRLIIIFKKYVPINKRYIWAQSCSPRAIPMMTFSWVWSIFLSLPPLFGWGSYRPEKNGMSCAPSWSQPDDVSYNIFLFTFGFFLPLIIIIVSSFSVIITINKNISSIISDNIRQAAMERQAKVIRMVMRAQSKTKNIIIIFLNLRFVLLYQYLYSVGPPMLFCLWQAFLAFPR